MLLVLPFVWKTPHDARDIFFFCSLGVLGGMRPIISWPRCLFTYAPANQLVARRSQYIARPLMGSVVDGLASL